MKKIGMALYMIICRAFLNRQSIRLYMEGRNEWEGFRIGKIQTAGKSYSECEYIKCLLSGMILCDIIKEYRYVYSAVEPFTGENCFLILN